MKASSQLTNLPASCEVAASQVHHRFANGSFYSPMTIADLIRHDSPAAPRYLAILYITLVTGIVLAFVGAFGSYDSMRLPLRLLHFTVGALLIGALSAAASALLQRLFAGSQPLWTAIAVAMSMAPPGAWIIRQLLWFLAPQVLAFVSYHDLIVQVLTINLFVGSIIWVIQWQAGRTVEREISQIQPSAPTAFASLRSKLPTALRDAAILSLSAEDHYVRVRTDRGQALILMNLTSAIAAIEPEAGARIHRSHWVAREMARGVTRHAGRLGVRLDDNTVLPVSRAGHKLLRNLLDGQDLGA